VGDGCEAVAVVDGQGVQNGFPAVDSSSRVAPVLPAFDRCQVEHFERGLLGWEMTSPNRRLSEPGIQALDGVGIGYEIGGAFHPAAVRPVGSVHVGFGVLWRNS